MAGDIPGGPVVKTGPSNAGGVGRSLVGKLRFPHAHSQKKKKKTTHKT